MNIAILPDEMSTNMAVDINFLTSVNEAESGVSGRKSQRTIPLRTYTVTINPGGADDTMAILLANLGARWPLALKDYAGNYKLTDEPQDYTIETDTTVANLTKTFTPSTGTRTFSQRVLILDPDITLQVEVNGAPLTSGDSWSITDPGILVINSLLTSGDVLTVTGQYLVPVVFVDDAITMNTHFVKEDGSTFFSIDNMRLREIPEQELIDLLSL